jgi:ketosteroid isomerase-like protein
MTTNTSSTITTDTETHLAAIQGLYAAYARGDMDAVLAELADNVDWAAEAASTSVPWYGPYHGKSDVPRFFQAILSTVDISEFEILGLASNDTDVVATIHWTYTVKATGKRASMYMQHWWRFADDKVVLFRGSEDTEQSAAAFSAA